MPTTHSNLLALPVGDQVFCLGDLRIGSILCLRTNFRMSCAVLPVGDQVFCLGDLRIGSIQIKPRRQ